MTLFLQKLVNTLKVIEGIVDVETELRDDAQLMANLVAEGATNAAHLLVKVLDDTGPTIRREYADEYLGKREVWRGTYGADADEKAVCLGGFLTEDLSELLFEETVYFV